MKLPVLVSSKKHLNRFEEIYFQTPKFKRLLGRLRIPDDFPSITVSGSRFPAPTIYEYPADLIVKEKHVKLNGINHKGDLIEQEFPLSSDISFKMYHYKSPIGRLFTSDWIEILDEHNTTEILIMNNDIAHLSNKKRTKEIFELLNSLQQQNY